MCLAVSGCATTQLSDDRLEALDQSLAAAQRDEHAFAAHAASFFLKGGTPDEPLYDKAMRMLGRSLESLGLTYAASVYYADIARERRDPEYIPDALRGIERIVRGGPHDHNLLIEGFVASADLPQAPRDIQAFVDYHKALQDMRNHDHDWAEARLAKIGKDTAYYHPARYMLAVRHVARGEIEPAIEALEALLDIEGLAADVTRDARRSLARLHLSGARPKEALVLYEKLRALAPDDPELLLELAWTHYKLGDPRRALGLLLALDAPVYGGLIAPERFLLEAMSLRRLCQFEPARLAAVRLQSRHRAELQELYDGIPPAKSKALQATARRRGEARKAADFVDRLATERKMLGELQDDLGEHLWETLKGVYSRAIQEGRRVERLKVKAEAQALADELLQAEEGVTLILHELGVAILRGHSRPTEVATAPPIAIPAGGKRVFYTFENEFWTDELDDLVVLVEDRCIE